MTDLVTGIARTSPHHTHGRQASCCDHHHAPTLGPLDQTALIGARGLSVVRDGRRLIDNVDIDVHEREIVTVIGPNGAGKTTLVKALMSLLPADAGELHKRPGLRIGYVPQRFDVERALPMTVERFLILGDRRHRAKVAGVLAEVGAEQIASRQLAELSGGELQRVALARALIGNPQLLVLDEPVSGVDYTGEAELYDLIGRLRDHRGLGVLLVSHDLHVVMASSDRVVCLSRHVCCSGVPETVAGHPEYVQLFGPEAARAFGLYLHHHDHRHDLAGAERPPAPGGNQ